jgi:1,4-alpha-glucan branching enzyme
MDGFMNLLTNPRGLDSWSKAVSMISNHDEVGNALRTIDVADGQGRPAWPNQFARSASRFAAGMGFAGPGMPMFFQGDESLANNIFKWGKPNTWDNGWEWEKTGQNWDWKNMTFNDGQKANFERLFSMSPADRAKDSGYTGLSVADKQVFNDLAKLPPDQQQDTMHNIVRRQTNEFYKAAIALRQSSPAFEADAEIKRVYSHNDNSVMAFERKGGNDDFVVVGSLNRNNLEHYKMSLPPGQWQECFNSDGKAFGGNNFGNYGATINGGNAEVNIPAGGYVVFKKVG